LFDIHPLNQISSLPSHLTTLRAVQHPIALIDQFARWRELADIERAISVSEFAVRLTPEGSKMKAKRLTNVGNAFLYRLKHLGDLADIERDLNSQGRRTSYSLTSPLASPTLEVPFSTLG